MLEDSGRQICVLLCDDDPVDRKLIKAYLKKIDGFSFEFVEIEVENDQLVLATLKEKPVDLIILDMQMPGKSGLEWLEEFTRIKCAPVIMLTGHGNETVAVEAMKAGAHDYLSKSQLSSDSLNRVINNALEKWKLERQLESYQKQLEYLATTDELTGLANRRFVMESLKNEVERFARYQHPVSLLLMDLDKFKLVNDTYGHLMGDEVLQTVAQIVKESIRSTDVAGRYGGDEFFVVLPNTPIEGAHELAERIRSNIESKAVFQGKDHHFRVKASIGVATLPAGSCEGNLVEVLLQQSDLALYEAKKKGAIL